MAQLPEKLEALLRDNIQKWIGLKKQSNIEILIIPSGLSKTENRKHMSAFCQLREFRLCKIKSIENGYLNAFYDDPNYCEHESYVPLENIIITDGRYYSGLDNLLKDLS